MSRTGDAIDIIARVAGLPTTELARDTELVADLDMDSAKALELLVELEDHFDIEISDDDANAMNTVGDILDAVERFDR
ncbi:MAG: phosphopantetheine-binding protein [Holophagae bacterium]|jgi:acyl carrier protein